MQLKQEFWSGNL